MTQSNHTNFAARLREINKRHERLAAGYVRLEERDGLLVPVERRRIRRANGRPIYGMATALGALFLFKGFLLAYLGNGTYVQRLSDLTGGSQLEQVGGWIMAADPLTRWIAAQFGLLF